MGVAVAITALLSLPVGVAIGLCLPRCITRTSAGREKKAGQLGGAINEEPSPVETAIPITDNQAYDPVIPITDNQAYDPAIPLTDNQAYDPAIPITDNQAYDPAIPLTDNQAYDPACYTSH